MSTVKPSRPPGFKTQQFKNALFLETAGSECSGGWETKQSPHLSSLEQGQGSGKAQSPRPPRELICSIITSIPLRSVHINNPLYEYCQTLPSTWVQDPAIRSLRTLCFWKLPDLMHVTQDSTTESILSEVSNEPHRSSSALYFPSDSPLSWLDKGSKESWSRKHLSHKDFSARSSMLW